MVCRAGGGAVRPDSRYKDPDPHAQRNREGRDPGEGMLREGSRSRGGGGRLGSPPVMDVHDPFPSISGGRS